MAAPTALLSRPASLKGNTIRLSNSQASGVPMITTGRPNAAQRLKLISALKTFWKIATAAALPGLPMIKPKPPIVAL